MEKTEKEERFAVWVDWVHRVISFSEADGFEKLQFLTQEEKFDFVMKRGYEGFGIQ